MSLKLNFAEAISIAIETVIHFIVQHWKKKSCLNQHPRLLERALKSTCWLVHSHRIIIIFWSYFTCLHCQMTCHVCKLPMKAPLLTTLDRTTPLPCTMNILLAYIFLFHISNQLPYSENRGGLIWLRRVGWRISVFQSLAVIETCSFSSLKTMEWPLNQNPRLYMIYMDFYSLTWWKNSFWTVFLGAPMKLLYDVKPFYI